MAQKASIVLLTDFGNRDGYVGIMKGVIKHILPSADIIDLAHDLPPQSILAAQFVLWNAYTFFPKGSIFVCVVDPGVGSKRKIRAYSFDNYTFIVPDNGVIDYVLAENKITYAFDIENPKLMRSNISNSFHGRDIFAPVAAHLAKGFPITQLGPTIGNFSYPSSPFISPEEAKQGEVHIIYEDRYGNLITNIKGEIQASSVSLQQRHIKLVSNYAAVEDGELLIHQASHGLWEIAVRNGHAASSLQLSMGDKIQLSF
ncbi:MAG: SAM-dependent chlorinase/fluorinase [Bacteroidota bacterium]